MTPRDDERRKFEAWYALQTGFDKTPEHPEVLWHGWLARAEQAETPLDGPTSCTVCGAAMEFKCPSCGSTPAPTKPVQAKTPRAAELTCPSCGHKAHSPGSCSFSVGVMDTGCECAAAAPVEDRPAPVNTEGMFVRGVWSEIVNVCPRCANTHWCPADCLPQHKAPTPLSEFVSDTEKLVTCKGQPEPHIRIHACREPIVEDRPAPTLPKTVGHDYNCACDECLAPTPPYPDHECAGCNLGKELMVGKPSSVVGQGAIHLPEGWVCMKWLEPKAYAAYVRMERIKSQLAGAPEKE